VDPIHALIDGGVNRLDARPVFLAAAPLPSADGPRAQADRGDFKIALSESSSNHRYPTIQQSKAVKRTPSSMAVSSEITGYFDSTVSTVTVGGTRKRTGR